MKKNWQTPELLSLGDIAGITRGKFAHGTDSTCGSVPDIFNPPTPDNTSSTDAVIRP